MCKTRLDCAAEANNHLFIPFIMAGDPTPGLTVDLGLLMEHSGADILEVGVPYSDPLADGPVIQAAAIRALEQGMNLEKAMKLVSKMREKGLSIPVIIFTYYNPVLQLGEEKLFKLMHENQIDGILIPDLPFEESQNLAKRCDEEKLPLISLVAPTSKERVKKIAENAKGFLYCVSSLGVTGIRKEIDPQINEFLQEVKKYSNVPIAVGFGISNREQVEKLQPHCDGVIVGSALVKMIESRGTEMINEKTREKVFLEIKIFVNSLISS